jgi:hypothetical protein
MHFPNPNGRTINGTLISTTVAQDLEPEYITTTNEIAYVTLQENNGLAIVNLADNTMQVIGLGFKDWSDYQFDGMVFVTVNDSPTGKALLVIGNEVSVTVAVWQVTEK